MTRRNNEARLGLPTAGAKQSSETPPIHESEDNQLSYVVPTEIIDFPSQGKFYPPDSSLSGKGEIEIKEMTAKEEDILTTESFIRKGIMFDRLLRSLIVDRSIKPEELLVGDRNALLIAARISAYGAIYETEIQCPACDVTDKNYGFDLSLCPTKPPVDLSTTEDEELRGNVEATDEGNFLITLPKSQLLVEVRLLNGKDESSISQSQAMRKKKRLPENPLTQHFKRIVVSVNGVTDSFEKEKFIDSMPASDSRFLREVFRKLTPNIEMKQEFICANCEYEQDLEVPLTARFFWPDI